MKNKTFEQTGLIPRSIIRTFERFIKQLFPEAKKQVLQEFRISRYQVLVSVQTLVILFFFPLLVNFTLKNFVIMPATEFFWNTFQKEIFINPSQQAKAFHEIKDFEEIIYFENFLEFSSLKEKKEENNLLVHLAFQEKTLEVAIKYNQQTILALTNIITDFFTLLTLIFLFLLMKTQIIILKSFLIECFYSFSDTTKSFLLIFSTDLLVGFHSPRGWDLLLEIIFKRFGLPENENFVLLFVASFPVVLDTLFKYWIFRYLNKISPSTVATYHNMIE
jgi:hypothetical protein